MTLIDYAAAPPRPFADSRRVPLGIELALLFFAAPLLVLSGLWPTKGIMVLLAAGTAYAAVVAWRGRAERADLGMGRAGWAGAWPTARTGLALFGVALAAAVALHLLLGRRVLPLVADQPRLFLTFCVVYAGSVAAQEFVFRGFFFWRYRGLLSDEWLLALNALSFGWVHAVFGSWVPVALCVPGGLVFGWLFLRHRSLAGACVVHAAFGLGVFAMGYGLYFWSGSGEVARLLLASSP